MMKLKKKKGYLIEITESAKQHIISKAESEEEECGILVGVLVNDKRALVTHAISNNYTKDKSFLHVTRKTDNIYPELESVINRFTEIDYIGEWHSHPMGLKRKSSLDHRTMSEMIDNKKFGGFKTLILAICVKNFRNDFNLIGYFFQRNISHKANINVISDGRIDKYSINLR